MIFTSRLKKHPCLPLLALLCLAISGCMVGPKYHPPITVAPPVYKEDPTNQQVNPTDSAELSSDPTFNGIGDWKVAQPQDARLRGKWWEIYNDHELNALEEQLNIDNQNIKQFFENFIAARALAQQARSQRFPAAAITPSYSRSRSPAFGGAGRVVSGNGVAGNPSVLDNASAVGSGTGFTTSFIDLPLQISWEPDLWGRVRNTIRQAEYAAQISAADLENTRLTEQAALATFFFEIRGQDALIQILNSTIAANRKALDFTRAQYETGLTDQISVVQAESNLESSQSQAANLGIARAQFEHAIALLLGKEASLFSIPSKALLSTPPPIPVGLPSQLLERRPDIAAAERTMAAANAQIGIAEAAYYPVLGLSASGGFENTAWKQLFRWSSRFWSIGASLSQTVFDAGLRRATVNQFIAVYNANLASYRQTVLAAFQQVEDALAAMRILTQQIQQQHKAVESAKVALDLQMQRYETGIDPYINVITQQNALLNAQLNLAQIEILRMTASVTLIEALGGGWDSSQLPTPHQVVAPLPKTVTVQQR